MTDITLDYAKDLKMNSDGTINMTAKFSHIDVEIPFTASPNDVMEYGPLIHARAIEGEFGVIAPYIPPTPVEAASKVNPQRRKKEMDEAYVQWQQWGILEDEAMVTAWKNKYQELYDLINSEFWPLVETWPATPVKVA